MKIKMKALYAGPLGCFQPGETATVGDEEGKALVEGRFAIEVTARDEARENAMRLSPERAAHAPNAEATSRTAQRKIRQAEAAAKKDADSK